MVLFAKNARMGHTQQKACQIASIALVEGIHQIR
jgi:hypothetical protein